MLTSHAISTARRLYFLSIPLRLPALFSRGLNTKLQDSNYDSHPSVQALCRSFSTPAFQVESGPHMFPLRENVISELTPTMRRFTLRDKVAVVTGGAQGLGLNMAHALAECGIRGIALMDVKDDIGQQTARGLSERSGVDATFQLVDVCNEISVSKAVRSITERYGKIDILVNSAGIADSNIKAETYPSTKFRRLVDINLTGSFLVAQACAQTMISQNTCGSIIFIASMSGQIVNYPQEQCVYNASKAGVVQLAKSLAAEWAKHNIRVNSISPGYMDTALNRVASLEAQKKIWIDRTPQKRLGGADELNALAVYLASNEASGYMTGSNLVIDGGYTVL